MKKKWLGLMIGALALTQTTSIMANDLLIATKDEVAIEKDVETQKSNYTTLTGEVTEVTNGNDNYVIIIGTHMDGARLVVEPRTLIMNSEDLSFAKPEDIKVGMSLTVVVPKLAPVGMSLPPMYGQQTAIIINSPNYNMEVGYFDETLTNEANTLALNITEDTQILKSNGEKRIFTADDVKNTDAIVFYTVSTRSIPAQTNPELVMILAEEETVEVDETCDLPVNPDSKSTKGSYELVRNIVAQGEYQLTWDHVNKTATLTKDGDTLIFKAGDMSYTHNNEVVKLNQAIIIEDSTMYVPNEVITLLELDA